MATEPAVEDVGRLQRSAPRRQHAARCDVAVAVDRHARRHDTGGDRRERRRLQRDVVGDHHPDRTLGGGRSTARGEVGGAGRPDRRGRAGVLVVPDGPPVRRDPAGRRADRCSGAAGAVAGADRRRAGHAVLPDGLRRRAWCRPTSCRTRSAATGSPMRPPSRSANCRTTPSTCSRSCTRFPQAEATFGFLADGSEGKCVAAQPRLAEVLVRVRGARHRQLAAGRAGPRVAGGELARGRRRRPSRYWSGATPESATCCTRTSSRLPCSTGRWRRWARAKWMPRG